MRICIPALLLSLFIFGCDSTEDDTITLDEIREATVPFSDVNAATAAGYVLPEDECVSVPGLGAMGVHYVKPALLGMNPQAPVNEQGRVVGTDAEIDLLQPEILLYEPQEDGSQKLIGIEYLVFKDAWEAAGHTEPPTFQGTAFDYMEDDPETPVDEAHGFAPHYDIHVWLFEDNPSGLLAQFNPNVTCPESDHH